MDNQQANSLSSGNFTWRIKNFSKLKNTKKLYSTTFIIGGYQWRILLFPKGNNVDYLSLYLDVANSASLPYGWSRYATFRFAVVNQKSVNDTVYKATQHCFDMRESDWGFTSFMPLSELHDPSRSFIEEDTITISAEVSIHESEKDNQVDKASDTTSLKSEQMDVKQQEQEQEACNTMDGLSDFQGIGRIENAFIPLLEEACSKHPSLLECQNKRSGRFVEWAFTALGRVLHFLKTKKVKDMNDEACEQLQILWEELETFRFDLTWLEPHVQSALSRKNYMEKAGQVKRSKENVSGLKMEMKRIEAKLVAAELDLDIAKRDLVQAQERFEEMDLDAELGYGKP